MAVRALALDVAVSQEHALHRVVELLDFLAVDEARLLEPRVDVLRELRILGGVGRVPMIEAEVKALQVARAAGGDARYQLLRRDPFGFRLQHDGRAVGVVGTDEEQLVPLHSLETHPDVGLDVLHDVADV
jgi:hypothetical protein